MVLLLALILTAQQGWMQEKIEANIKVLKEREGALVEIVMESSVLLLATGSPFLKVVILEVLNDIMFVRKNIRSMRRIIRKLEEGEKKWERRR